MHLGLKRGNCVEKEEIQRGREECDIVGLTGGILATLRMWERKEVGKAA